MAYVGSTPPEPASRGSAEPTQPAWMHQAEKPKRRWGCAGPIVGCLIGVGALVVIGVAVIFGVGMTMFSGQAEDALRANPVIAQHLGELEEIDMQWFESMQHPGAETFVFRLVGSRGRGKAEAELVTVDAMTEEVVGGVLILDSGERYDLVPEEAEPPPGTDPATDPS